MCAMNRDRLWRPKASPSVNHGTVASTTGERPEQGRVLLEQNSYRRNWSANVGHDIRTPRIALASHRTSHPARPEHADRAVVPASCWRDLLVRRQ